MNFVFTFLIFFSGICFSQTYILMDSHFSKKEQEIANTAFNISCLKDQEKKIFFYLNLARINPKLFAKTFLTQNRDNIDCFRDYQSLYDELMNMSSLHPIYFDEDFYNYAKCHAIQSGHLDYVGHNRKNGSGCVDIVSNSFWGECCYYGTNDPLVIVLDLLVDCNYPDLGHRKILLSENFRSMGVFIAPHSTYDFNTVLDFTDE